MAIVRPAITGDIIQDSWADQVTKALNNATLSGGTGGIGGTGSGTGPPGTDGFNTATLYLFQRSTDETAPAAIAVDTTYEYETGVLMDANGNTGSPVDDDPIDGLWFRVIPDTTIGEFVWVIVVNIADQGGTETIAASTWSTVVLLSRPGDDASTVIIQAFAEDPSLNQVTSWIPPFMGISQVSPNFKNDTAQVIGLIPTIYEGGGEISAAVHTAATYQWSKNGIDFVQTVPVETGTGGQERVLLINQEDIREGNFNEVFNVNIDY